MHANARNPDLDQNFQETRLLAESFNLSLRYSNEYIDKNPLISEPGSLILLKSTNNPEASHAESSQPKSALALTTTLRPPTPKVDTSVAGTGAKGADEEKSPTTPGVKGKKERRKSNCVVANTTPTPK
ncbi:MAG: hypothetical protein LQ347_005394 [Umbilicaria vellea]|nr:MAG: hypothetical protein LQ347_005394 [Umbilicaria vellea]